MPKLSVTIITKNEAADLAAALESVRWADEIVVVDSESTDDTVSIARRVTDRVFVRPWPGYIEQKNYAASVATNDWILSLDADERVTPALAKEIQDVLQHPTHAAYRMPRVTWHLGRWIRSTDWYPDRQLRLFDRRTAKWTGRYVHETLTVDGSVGELTGELQHFAYRNIADHLETIDRYTTYWARQTHESGRRASYLQMAVHPPLAFFRNYFARGGIRDGIPGLIVSAMNAYYVFIKLAKLRELNSPQGAADHGSPANDHPAPARSTPHPAPGTSAQHPAPRTSDPESD